MVDSFYVFVLADEGFELVICSVKVFVVKKTASR